MDTKNARGTYAYMQSKRVKQINITNLSAFILHAFGHFSAACRGKPEDIVLDFHHMPENELRSLTY